MLFMEVQMNKKQKAAKTSLPAPGPNQIIVDKSEYLKMVSFRHQAQNAAAAYFGWAPFHQRASEIVERGRLHTLEIFEPATCPEDMEEVMNLVNDSLMSTQSEIDFIGSMYYLVETDGAAVC